MEKIKVCADFFPPYQYIDEDGKVKGWDYELIADRLRRAGYEPQMWIGPWDDIYEAFERGDQEVLFQAQDSPERLEKFYLSKLLRYAVTEVVTMHQDMLTLERHSQLQDYKVGVIKGFANGPEIDELSDECKVQFDGTKEILEGIYSGEIDCGVCDQGVKEYLLSGKNDLYPIEKLTYKRSLYVMFRKKKHRDAFDAAGKEE